MRSHNDRKKLQGFGFTILRVRESAISLVALDWKSLSWKTWKKFENMNQLNKELTRIDIEEPKIIIE